MASPAPLSNHAPHQDYPEVSWTYTPRIEPGEHHAFSGTAKIYRDRLYKRWVCAVEFNILNDSLIEVVAKLTWYLNLGSGEKIKTGRRTKYWQAWVTANAGPPKRKDRMTPHVFNNRYAVVQVGDIANGEYSVVRSVVRWEEIGVRPETSESCPF